MGRPATLVVNIIGNANKFIAETQKTNGAVSTFSRTVAGVGSVVAGAFAVDSVVTFAQEAVAAASEVQQAMGAVQSVFKDSAGQVQKYADAAATTVGLSKGEYGNLAAILGSQLKNMGTPMGKLAGQTNDLVTLGADLAAQFGGPTSKAVEAISSLLKGERDPIEAYGVSLSQAAIDAKVAAMGLDTSTDAAKKNADAQATLALLSQQTADAQGAFARESNTAAGAQAIATANFENAQATLGQRLLPALTAVMGFISSTAIPTVLAIADGIQSFVGWLTGTSTAAQILLPIIGGMVAAFAAYLAIVTAVRIATAIWTGIQAVWNAVMAANPLVLITLLIVGLVAAIIIAYQRSETFRKIVQAVFSAVGKAVGTAVDAVVDAFNWCKDKVSSIFSGISDAISGAIDGIVGFFDGWIQKIKDVISWLGDLVVPDWLKDAASWAGNLFSAPAPTVNLYAARSGGYAAAPPAMVTAASVGSARVPIVRVYIGERELSGLVRTEVRSENASLARRIQSRPGRTVR